MRFILNNNNNNNNKFLLKGDPHPRKFYIFRPIGYGTKIPENSVKIAPEMKVAIEKKCQQYCTLYAGTKRIKRSP